MSKIFKDTHRQMAACILSLMAVTNAAVAQTKQPSPALGSAELPAPPKQKVGWTPPMTTLPKKLVTATSSLFTAGLADPRGGDYRTIKVGTGSCWSGDAGVVETHGWVLPDGKSGKRFAVCWNGLVYPVVSVGDKADLQADIRAVIKADEKLRAQNDNFYRFRNATSEGQAVSHESMLPIKTCLLLRLGKIKLAQEFWQAWIAGMRADTNDDAVHLKDPYLMLATDWVWARFDRAVCGHMRGDDKLALVDARALVGMKAAVETEAKKRGFTIPSGRKSYLDFLDQAPQLLADQERRGKAPKRKPLPKNASKAKRIASLIQDLENVSERQNGQPGGVDLGWSPVVKALVKEGEDAVEPLLDCLEKDHRLTRSVHFHRDFFRHRMILGVHEAAYVALAEILQTSFFGVAATGDDLTARGAKGRKKVADAIRAYWKRFKGVSLAKRWYLILKDDNVSPGHWLQAAGNITQPTDVSVSRGSMFGTGWTTVPDRKPGAKPAIRGEPLRKLKDPSITQLMIQRIEAMCKLGAPGSERFYSIHNACQMTYRLGTWDLKASRPVAAGMVKLCGSYIANHRDGNPELLGPAIADLTAMRSDAGDAQALGDYADWLRTVPPDKASSGTWREILQPMWRNPTDKSVVAAAEAMFDNAGAPWTKKFLRAGSTYDLFDTPMLGVAAFRKRLLVELEDRRPAGKLKMDDGVGFLEVAGAYSGGAGIHYDGDPLAPPAGAKEAAFRVCDYYAYQLSRIDGFPRCEVYWPERDRDKAVTACAAFLKKHGNQFRYSAKYSSANDYWGRDRARLVFPKRNRPATVKEVNEGQAVFAFPKEKKVRVVKLKEFPKKARWKTLKDFPNPAYLYNKKRRVTWPNPKYLQEGYIWQTEEVFENGQWQRYYGFVGDHIVAKAPAAEIEFLETK